MPNYTETIRHWAADSRRSGVLSDANGIGEVGLSAEEAGRRLAVRFFLRVNSDVVESVRFQVFGCGFTIAACAATAELAEGHSLAEVEAITPSAVDTALAGLPPERSYCASLAIEALKAAVKSVSIGQPAVRDIIYPEQSEAHGSRITANNPVYRLLNDSPTSPDVPLEDRHLFACLLAVAASETCDIAAALGLNDNDLSNLLCYYFPHITPSQLGLHSVQIISDNFVINPDILDLLFAHLPVDSNGLVPRPSLWLARIIAARSAHPGHLWLAMGLFARPELTSAIHRHLPALADANKNRMRWKRFLFKQLCEQEGGSMCKTPDCGVCSDYALCFASE